MGLFSWIARTYLKTVDFSAKISQDPSRGLTTEQHWNIWHSSRFSFVNKSDRNVILAANQSFSSNEIKLAITKTLTSGEKRGIFIPGGKKVTFRSQRTKVHLLRPLSKSQLFCSKNSLSLETSSALYDMREHSTMYGIFDRRKRSPKTQRNA